VQIAIALKAPANGRTDGARLRERLGYNSYATVDVFQRHNELDMPCWIVDWWRGIAWWLVGPIPVLVVIVLMLWAPRVRWQWLKVLLRIIGGLAASFLIVVIGFGLLLSGGAPKPQYQTIDSPNGLHRATLMYQAGFLGRDSSEVEITTKNSCKRLTAYTYEGPCNITGTAMTWVDDSHFQIKYELDRDRYQHCETQIGDVSVTCIPLTAGTH
jgi:hypothetical protein